MEQANFWQLFSISLLWYRKTIAASINGEVGAIFQFQQIVIIAHKFSMGFKSGELPSHSITFI